MVEWQIPLDSSPSMFDHGETNGGRMNLLQICNMKQVAREEKECFKFQGDPMLGLDAVFCSRKVSSSPSRGFLTCCCKNSRHCRRHRWQLLPKSGYITQARSTLRKEPRVNSGVFKQARINAATINSTSNVIVNEVQ